MTTKTSPQGKGLQVSGCRSPRTCTMRPPLRALSLALRASRREDSLGSSSYSWIKEGFKLSESRRDQESLAQEIQPASPPLTNLQLNDHRVGRIFGKTVLHRLMDHDMSQNLRRASMGVDNTMGHIRAHISQVRPLHT